MPHPIEKPFHLCAECDEACDCSAVSSEMCMGCTECIEDETDLYDEDEEDDVCSHCGADMNWPDDHTSDCPNRKVSA